MCSTTQWAGRMGQDERQPVEKAIIHLKGNSRTRKHRLSELQAREAEEDIKDYASATIQDSVRGVDIQE